LQWYRGYGTCCRKQNIIRSVACIQTASGALGTNVATCFRFRMIPFSFSELKQFTAPQRHHVSAGDSGHSGGGAYDDAG